MPSEWHINIYNIQCHFFKWSNLWLYYDILYLLLTDSSAHTDRHTSDGPRVCSCPRLPLYGERHLPIRKDGLSENILMRKLAYDRTEKLFWRDPPTSLCQPTPTQGLVIYRNGVVGACTGIMCTYQYISVHVYHKWALQTPTEMTSRIPVEKRAYSVSVYGPCTKTNLWLFCRYQHCACIAPAISLCMYVDWIKL